MPLAQIKLRTFIDLTDASTDAGAAHRELVVGQNQIIFYLRGQKPSSPLQKFNPDVSIPIFCSDNAAQCSVKTAPNCLLSRQQENSTPAFVTQRNVLFFETVTTSTHAVLPVYSRDTGFPSASLGPI